MTEHRKNIYSFLHKGIFFCKKTKTTNKIEMHEKKNTFVN